MQGPILFIKAQENNTAQRVQVCRRRSPKALKINQRRCCFQYAVDKIDIILIISNNSNWTKWSKIRGVIVRVISKSDEREARGRFEVTRTITP